MTINIGIIGCGAITRHRHAPEYSDNKKCRIAAFSDPVPERARDMAEKYGGDVYEDYHKIIEDPAIDAVSVCTSNATHAKISIEALEAGKHVLCEKPMAVTSDEAKSMVDAAGRNNRILMPGHNQRLFPAHIKAKDIIKSGEMGKLLSFRSSFKHKGPETWSSDNGAHTWFFDKKLASIGVLGDLGVHKIDMMRWLLEEEFTSIFASIATLDKRYPTGELIQVEDNAIVLAATDSRKTGIFEFSWTNYGGQDNSTILYCEKGVLKLYCSPDADLLAEMRDGSTVRYKFSDISTNEKQQKSGVIDNFIDAVASNKSPIATGDDGYRAIVILEACILSASKGMLVEIAY